MIVTILVLSAGLTIGCFGKYVCECLKISFGTVVHFLCDSIYMNGMSIYPRQTNGNMSFYVDMFTHLAPVIPGEVWPIAPATEPA